MWIVSLALRRPYTFIVMALVIILLTPLILLRTPVDIFPEINIPVISVVWNYTGLAPEEMADRLASNSERAMTTLVSDIDHVESQSLNGISVIKLFLNPNANLQNAMAEVTAVAQINIRQAPPGTVPPLIIEFTASSVPVIQLGLSSKTLPEQQLFDLGNNFLRIQLATVPGAASPYPYGGKLRLISVDLDTPALQANGLTPVDVVNALSVQNLVLPSGTAKIGALENTVEMNGTPETIAELNDLPVKIGNGSAIYMRDVAHIRDGFSPQTNIVRMDGVRGSLMSISKVGQHASTLEIVDGIKRMVQRSASSLPPELKITPLFDQSLFVRASIAGVLREGIIAAALTALMILLFLGDWRPTLIIAISIPLSVFVSIILLSALGETINIMTLGGLALAVGILVDDATVTIENIERNIMQGKELKQAILDGAQQIAVPAFVSTLCICIVFVPMFFLTGVAKFLFVPLAEAVVFAMLASYLLSRTLVPTLVMYIMRGHEHKLASPRTLVGRMQRKFEEGFENFRGSYRDLLETVLAHRKGFVAAFLIVCLLSLGWTFFLGRDFFPAVDAGIFRLHLRARPGLRVEETARLTDEVEKVIRRTIPPREITTIIDNIGVPYSSVNLTYTNTGVIGSSDSDIQVALNRDHHPTVEYVNQLRRELPRDFPGVEFFFQPADIVAQILNFGLPAPIDVQVIGNDMQSNYEIAQQIANRMRRIPGAADVHVQQMMSLPTLRMDIDRTKIAQVGLSARDVAQNVLISLSGSFQTAPNFWLNRKNGVTYNMAVQTPQYKVTSLQDVLNTPVNNATARSSQVLGNLVHLTPTTRPAVVSHYNVQPVIDIYASTANRDLGGVSADTNNILKEFEGHLPRGTRIEVRGQVDTMNTSFRGLEIGLLMAIVLVYLLIVVNFQSWLDPFIIISGLTGALAGIVWMLLLTHTRLSVPSLTGSIMCMGVATANSILLVSAARDAMMEGFTPLQAALEAGYARIRPVIMTALAMIIGMLPMALSIGEGGEQNAPLGRAVIGGLLLATVATLFFVPAVFAMVHGRQPAIASAEVDRS